VARLAAGSALTGANRINPVLQRVNAFLAGAVGAAVDDAVGFYAMAYNLNTAIITRRRQHLNRAFKRIKFMPVPRHLYGKGLIIIIATKITYCHLVIPLKMGR
jgi:hypothetical protein